MADMMMQENAVQWLQENSIQHNKVVDSFVANTAKTAANFISGYATPCLIERTVRVQGCQHAQVIRMAVMYSSPQQPQLVACKAVVVWLCAMAPFCSCAVDCR